MTENNCDYLGLEVAQWIFFLEGSQSADSNLPKGKKINAHPRKESIIKSSSHRIFERHNTAWVSRWMSELPRAKRFRAFFPPLALHYPLEVVEKKWNFALNVRFSSRRHAKDEIGNWIRLFLGWAVESSSSPAFRARWQISICTMPCTLLNLVISTRRKQVGLSSL